MNTSQIQESKSVAFPAFTGERVHMQKFTKNAGLPSYLERWQSTVDAMLNGVEANGNIFIMIHQGQIIKNTHHRRGGIHIDGNWIEGLSAHDGEPTHSGLSAHGNPTPTPGHRMGLSSGWGPPDRWKEVSSNPQTLILASDVQACIAFTGEYESAEFNGGDCSYVNPRSLNSFGLKKNVVYVGDTLTLHESLPLEYSCQRTVVRLNVVN
jgi:hypothetical protein